MILFTVWLLFKAKTPRSPEGRHGPFHPIFGLLPPVLQEFVAIFDLFSLLGCVVLVLSPPFSFMFLSLSTPLSNLQLSFPSSPSCLSSSLVVPFPSPLSQQLLPTSIFGTEWEQAILVTLLWNNWVEQMIFFEQIEDTSRRQASKVKTSLGNTCPAGSFFPTPRIT